MTPALQVAVAQTNVDCLQLEQNLASHARWIFIRQLQDLCPSEQDINTGIGHTHKIATQTLVG